MTASQRPDQAGDRLDVDVLVHVLADGTADLMGEAAAAVSSGLTTAGLARAIHPRPTLTEAFGLAAATAEATR